MWWFFNPTLTWEQDSSKQFWKYHASLFQDDTDNMNIEVIVPSGSRNGSPSPSSSGNIFDNKKIFWITLMSVFCPFSVLKLFQLGSQPKFLNFSFWSQV